MTKNKIALASLLAVVALVLVGFSSYQYFFNEASNNSYQALVATGLNPNFVNSGSYTINPTPIKVIPNAVGKSFCLNQFQNCNSSANDNLNSCVKNTDAQIEQCAQNYSDQLDACKNSYKACVNTPSSPSKPAPVQGTPVSNPSQSAQ